jgi:signal transduction histidine kinase
MRTPVATIDGYLSLALNPQTATIDERARGYLTAAQAASQHLGKLFRDLLDVTKLDDGRIRPHLEPVEMVGLVKQISDDYLQRAVEAKINFTFGSGDATNLVGNRRMEQVVYSFVDVNFMREILDNVIDNALKYTPEGGSVYVNVRGDGDRVLLNVTDTGIGISSDDLGHIFQKFYRADNSDTRTIGGTGLGLYLVKQRVEAMGGKVWAESAFGEGSTFYVSLPRLTSEEYEKRMIAVRNQKMQEQLSHANQPAPQPMQQPAPQPVPQPIQPVPQVAPQPTPPAPPAPPAAAPTINANQINNNQNGGVK